MRWRFSEKNPVKFYNVQDVWQLDDVRLYLVHWVQVYSSIYEMPENERPSEDVINDDARLDRWFMSRPSSSKNNEYDDSNFGDYKAHRSLGD